MGTCFFFATGSEFDVDEFLLHSTIVPAQIFRKGDPSPKGAPIRSDNAFNLLIHKDDSPGFKTLKEPALAFLRRYAPEFECMQRAGATLLVLEFRASSSRKGRPLFLGHELLKAAGENSVSMAFSED